MLHAIFSFLILLGLLAPSLSEAATLSGQPVRGGGKVEIAFPVAKYFQDIAAQGGNPRRNGQGGPDVSAGF